MESFKGYVSKYGFPLGFYLHRQTTYKFPLEEELSMSEFEGALKRLWVEVIHAYSPQVKDRGERLFGVLQDRLINEMRLKGIKTKDEANEFLETYLPGYNQWFRLCPANDTDVQVRLATHVNLDCYLVHQDGAHRQE